MRRNGVYVYRLTGLAAALVLATGAGGALAQDTPFLLGYYSGAHTTGAPDATLRVVNDGQVSDVSPAGDLCASTYVFDSSEQLIECCSCPVTPNGLLTLSVNTNLTANTLTRAVPTRGVVKVLSSQPNPGTGLCDPTIPAGLLGIHGWITHIQTTGRSSLQTEQELTDSSLGAGEFFDLLEDCFVAIELGSGQGVCSCTDAGR